MRVALADDSALFRQGLATLLQASGVEVVAQAASGAELLALVAGDPPDAVVLDLRMPPTFTDEGLVAAEQLRARFPRLGVLVLSTYAEVAYAARHADAGKVQVAVREDGGRLVLEVADDGVGGADATSGRGLTGMADRVAALGGSLVVDSPPGSGTRIEVSLPCG